MEEPYQDERTEELGKKVMPLPEEPREGICRESEKTGPVKNKDGVYEY